MKYLRVNNLNNIFNQCDYKGLNINQFISGSQVYATDLSYCILATNEELITLPIDVIELNEADYNNQRAQIQAGIDATNIGTLVGAQSAKTIQINDLYDKKLAIGFTSSASGAEKSYIYNNEAQKDFSDLFLLKANGVLTYPVTVYSSVGESISLTQVQLTQLMADIATFKLGLSNNKHDYLVQVQTATTVDEVNAIVVAF